MKNFTILSHNIDVENCARELRVTPLWDWLNIRKLTPGHVDVADLIMRGPWLEGHVTFESVMNDIESVNYFPIWHLPATNDLAARVGYLFFDQKSYGRVMATRLAPWGCIHLHNDEGLYAEAHTRYHVVIDAGEDGQCDFYCGDECVALHTGMLFTFNHRLPHQVINNGALPRTNLIFDVRR